MPALLWVATGGENNAKNFGKFLLRQHHTLRTGYGTQKELTAKLRQNIDIYQGVDLTEQSRMTLAEWLEQMSTTLHHALSAAVEQGLIPTNPADEVEPPKVIRQPMNILNEDQPDTFMDAIKADPIWYDSFHTELTTGLRSGEICGLMWTDFDSRAGTGCVTQINEKLWEGQYSPSWPDGKKRARNIYDHSKEECEKLLAEMITEMKAEIADERERLKAEPKAG